MLYVWYRSYICELEVIDSNEMMMQMINPI